ncbi:MAG TPA: iron chelate uptake ABC transporter family permease subunit, partial [Tenuifilaceae bacterium]|nr:iron chelate uptake ABC transporter family permease subunit [Tenuifilaceae bacterium]
MANKGNRSGRVVLFASLVILLIALFVLDLFIGSVRIPVADVFKILMGRGDNEVWQTIVNDFRLPKAIAAVLVGSALSVSGLQMQTVFRNPLAGPYVL